MRKFSIALLVLLMLSDFGHVHGQEVRTDDGKTYRTGRIAPTPARAKAAHAESWQKYGRKIAMMSNRAVPESYDCETLGIVPPIKDQGNCGSCHHFSACGPATSALIRRGHIKLSADGISEQWQLDCERQLGGCNGGWEWDDAEVILEKGGPLESEYGPYRAQAGSCRPISKRLKISKIGMCSQGDGVARTIDMQNAILNYGMISVAVAADNAFANYRGGLFNGSGSRSVNHAVCLTGWKTVNGKVYWKLRNSWGTGWGEAGYMWILAGANQVGDSAFWVDAEEIPGPPVPPTPPVPPGPIGKGQLILRYPGLPDQTFDITLPASNGKTVPDATPQELIDALRLIYGPKSGGPIKGIQPPVMDPAQSKACCGADIERRIAEQERAIGVITEAVLTLQEVLLPEPRQHPKSVSSLATRAEMLAELDRIDRVLRDYRTQRRQPSEYLLAERERLSAALER